MPVATRAIMKLAFALIALAGCARLEGTSECGGNPGLHVVVDLSGPNCAPLVQDPQNERTITATLASGELDKLDADQIQMISDPPSVDYRWRWPSGTADGWNGTITWSSNLEAHVGHATSPYQVRVDACVDVVLVATCGYATPDAGVAP